MVRILELFAGYGSQSLALENLGIEFTSDISEIDQYAIKAYNQIHGDTHNWGDIAKIDETKLPYYDLITYSSPCQDFSVAGLGRGGDEGSGTRSSLLWECERIIRAVKPKYLLMENVKNLVGEKHKHNFIRWLRVLEMMGYWNFWQVLNAKDYGVPQNRERVFVVSILGGDQYLFPNKIKLEKRLKDILEPVVDEKYYLSDKMVEGFLKHNDNHLGKTGFVWQPRDLNGYASALRANGALCPTDNTIAEPILIGGMQANQSIKTDGVCTCLTSSMGTGGGYVPMVTEPLAYDEQNGYVRKDGCVGTLTTDGSSPKHNNRVIEPLYIKEATHKGYAEAYDGDSVTLDQPNSQTRRGRVGKQISNTLTTSCNIGVVQVGNIVETDSFGGNPQRGRIYSTDGCSPALNTMQGGGLEPKIVEKYRIRKLTPRECWRLMGVKDEQYDKLHDISNTQLYKMAGNSIVVDVLMGIFKNLFLSDEGTKGQLTLF